MAKLNFYLKDKLADKETPIHLYVRYEGKRLVYSIGKSINPKFWNLKDKKYRQTKDLPLATRLNNNLKFIERTAEAELLKLKDQLQRTPTVQELKGRLDTVIKNQDNEASTADTILTFLELFKRFIQESETGIRQTSKGTNYDKRTIQKYSTTYDRLAKFGIKYNLTFETIDKNFYSKFVQSLNKDGYKLNTVGKYIQVLKAFLTYATENGYNTNMYFKSNMFKAHNVTGFSVYLNEDEITDLYKTDLSNTPHLERVRDLFIVACWTGLRFSDFSNLKPDNIEGGFFKVKTKKTGTTVIIPIHPIVKEIMEKYEGKYPNSLPPAISNQKMNEYIKDVAKEVISLKKEVTTEHIKGGLKVEENRQKWELTTTHTARRSFATNLYKSGFPAISIMKITGHRTEQAFLKYIKVTPEDTAQKLMEHWRQSVLKVV